VPDLGVAEGRPLLLDEETGEYQAVKLGLGRAHLWQDDTSIHSEPDL
jgi:hypothetical protein